MTAKPRILLTGAAGRVGTALWRGWEAQGRFDLTLTDRRPIEGARSPSEIGEIGDYTFVEKICADQDVLVHLAYISAANVGQGTLDLTDIGVSMRLFHRAHAAGITKIVLASTNHVTGWNEHLSDPRPSRPPTRLCPTAGMAQ